jgi:hypothetical protein
MKVWIRITLRKRKITKRSKNIRRMTIIKMKMIKKETKVMMRKHIMGKGIQRFG